jgi:cytochrome c oxidase subunit 3
MKLWSGVDVAHLSRFNPDQRAPLWWGILGLIAVEATVVSAFIVSYLYLAIYADVWPPAGLEPPPLLWPSINVAILMLSSGAMYWAGWGIRRGNQRILAVGVTIAVLLACVVLVLRSLEFAAFEFSWKDHAYGSAVWTIAGFHYVHVVSMIVGSAVVAVLAWRGYFTQQRQIAVVVDTMYWYFVSFAWIPFYITLYWVPRFYDG